MNLSTIVKILLSLTICILCFHLINAAENKSDCNRTEFDENLSIILGLFGLHGVNFPSNETEMDTFCSQSERNEKLTKSFIDDCLKGYSKTVMFIFSNNLKMWLQQFCGKTPTERQNFINWSECGNSGKKRTSKCWNRLMTNLWKTRKIEDSQDRIPSMCCNFLTWKSCTLNIFKDIGSPTCPADAVEGFETQINKSTLDVLQVLCDEYFEETTMCDTLKERLPKQTRGKRRRIINRTPFLALFEIFESLH